MAWLRIDDRARTHPKIVQAGPSAAWLWFCGLSYCREQLTDGVIAKKLVGSLAIGLGKPRHYAKKLVACGLWIDKGSHYEIHDFLDWNPSKADVIAQRNADSVRKRSNRHQPNIQPDSDRNPNGFQTDSSHARAPRAGSGLGSEIRDLDLSEKTESENSLAPVWVAPNGNPHAKSTNLVNGHDLRRHAQHAFCPSGRENLCVPHGLHAEIVAAAQASDEAVRAWYRQTITKFDGQPIGDDRFTFWRNELAAWLGSVTSRPAQTKGNRTMDAARRVAAQIVNGRFQ